MDVLDVKNIIENNYKLKILGVEKVKNTFKIRSENGDYCIKIIKYEFEHFNFILSAINHLQKRGFRKIPQIIKTKDNNEFIKIGGSYAYLTEWVKSRLSNYSDVYELSKITEKLGDFHKCSEQFVINKSMNPRIGWFSWINVFETRCNEILDFKKRINQKAYQSQVDKIYLSAVDSELKRGKRAIEDLKSNKYMNIMEKQVMKRGFCHHDFAHHNVLIDTNEEINVIDFDYCILDSYLHDLSSLMIRTMKGGKWNNDTANIILNSYSKSNNIYDEELKLMKSFIRFPQEFWQRGLQCYWEQQPWGDEFLEDKIRKYLVDVEEREIFLEKFF
ncbi:MAG: CotS family spore coat protein [Terrisporobacter sp.]